MKNCIEILETGNDTRKENTFMKKILQLSEKIAAWAKGLTTTQIAVGATAAGLVVAGVVCVVVIVNSLGSADALSTESTEGTESLYEETYIEETETIEAVMIHLTTTSIDKDLKVKIVDENDNLIEGQSFVITIAPVDEDADETEETEEDSSEETEEVVVEGDEYEDDDMDGIIHVQDLEGGDYLVYLQPIKGFELEENPITSTVKGQIEYQKIEIKNEIKDESQINAAVEDTAKNQVAVEAVLQDTTQLVESKVIPTVVGKENVDFSNFPEASVSSSLNTEVLTKTEIITTEPEPGTGDGTETPEGGTVSETALGISEINGALTRTTTTTQTKNATASLPQTATLYYYGKDASMMTTVSLTIDNTTGIITGYEWSIDDPSVVTCTPSADNKSASLVAQKAGTATITVTVSYVKDDAETIDTKTLTCVVSVGDYTDNSTQLVDKDGNGLYLDEKATQIATPASYSSATQFYGEPKYTGWQSKDGYLYYYKADNTLATGPQVIGGVQYEFHEDGTLKESEQTTGIDVSKWQGDIDWATVANAGIDFAIIRCAYRGSSTGVIVEDPYFKQNIKGATENGIKVGVYFFTQAITEAEAVEEASTAISLVQGYKLNFPIFIDTEGSGGRADNLSKQARTAIVKAFCETVRNSGYKPGIYASKYWYYDNLDVSQLSTYNIWVAQYNTVCNYNGRYDMWQYSSKGSVPGINGNVDMNICYTKY